MTDADAPLSPELEARLAAVEATAVDRDFDSVSWLWMLVLGLVVPLALIVGGWYLGPGAG
jgi:hypothetical protein